MAIFGWTGPDSASRAQHLAAEPDAARWARSCAWLAGTGHCRRRDCNDACIFREQRQAEARRIARWRRLRRSFVRRAAR
jgi:hypothetical protein